MHPLPSNHVPPLRACCVLNVCIAPFFPDAPFCLLWWRYCTLLSCMLSRPQCNLVCVIFSHECMHTGMALACGITAFQGWWVGGVLVINLMGECVYCEIFIWKVNMLPTSSFAELKILGLTEIDVNHLVSQYFQFSLKILNFKKKQNLC